LRYSNPFALSVAGIPEYFFVPKIAILHFLFVFIVARYISIERIIEQNKDRYYEILEQSSQGWHEERHDPWPYINYIFFTLKTAYREFEERVGQITSPKGAKTELIINAINGTTGSFRVTDIQKQCPGVGVDMVRKVLKTLKASGKVKCLSRGQNAQWQKTDR
jgi:hypothetical protein